MSKKLQKFYKRDKNEAFRLDFWIKNSTEHADHHPHEREDGEER